MSLLLYLLLILLFSVANAIVIVHINTDAREKIQKIQQEKKELLNQYNKVQEEIKELKKKIQTINNQIQEEKKLAQLKKIAPREEKKKLTPLEVLQEKGIISDEHIQKANDFIRKSNSNFETLEVLLLLGYIDHSHYQLAKEEAK